MTRASSSFRCAAPVRTAASVWLSIAASWSAASAVHARPDDFTDPFSFDRGDVVETYDTPRFRVHYTTSGVHRVLAGDIDSDGVPDSVQQLGAIYEEALTLYVDTLGFRAPVSDGATGGNNGGDARFDVYLVDFGLSADGVYRREACDGDVCSGYMVQENDFAGYGYPNARIGSRIVGSHELFHAVQAAYDNAQGGVLAEGTAVWATEHFDPSLRDLEGFAAGYLEEASNPLDADTTGAVDPFSYGAGIFFQSLSERYGDDVIRALWESVQDGAGGVADPQWADTIDGVLQAAAQVSFADAFAEFCGWTLLTGARADDAQGFVHGDEMDERTLTPIDTPYNEDRFTLFGASSRVVSALANGRATMRATLVGDASVLAPLRLLVLPLHAGTPGTIVAADAGSASLDVAMGSDDELAVLVVNTALGGASVRPGLCIGAPDEVAACVATQRQTVPPENDGDGSDDTVADQGSGCSSTRDASSSSMLVACAAMLALLPRRRSRRMRSAR